MAYIGLLSQESGLEQQMQSKPVSTPHHQTLSPEAVISVIVLGALYRNLEWREDFDKALAYIAQSGFKQVELIMDTQPVDMTFFEMHEIVKKHGLHIPSMHTRRSKLHPDWYALGCPEKETRMVGMERFIRYIYLTKEFGASQLIVHTAPMLHHVDPDNPMLAQRTKEAIERSLEILMPHLERTNTRILLENGWNGLPYSLPQQIYEVVEPYPEKYVGLVLDTDYPDDWHEQPQETILQIAPRLCNIHLSDLADGRKHMIPTHGNMDWDAIRGALAEINYQGQWTFEVAGNGDPIEALRLTHEIALSWGLR